MKIFIISLAMLGLNSFAQTFPGTNTQNTNVAPKTVTPRTVTPTTVQNTTVPNTTVPNRTVTPSTNMDGYRTRARNAVQQGFPNNTNSTDSSGSH